MTLKGLPVSPLPPGSVVLTSLVSVLVSTAGLALLRSTRPSKVQQISRSTSHYSGFPPCFFYNILGIFGALLLFLGQVLSSFPMLMGVSTDDEGKAAAIVQSTQVLLCWAVERYRIVGHALPMMQSSMCAIVWFGSTLVEWAGPRPYDNISLGLRSQVSGCDGGYRSPFLVYAAGYLTCITFGVLFLCVDEAEAPGPPPDPPNGLEDGHREQKPAATPTPKVATCRALPMVYGAAMAMSSLVFAQGTSTNDMRWVCFGALLLVVAVVCAWEWLWCVEHSLGTWAPVSQCFATLARLGQSHLVFRDFRWDPDSVNGILVVWRQPGLQFFLCGFVLLMTGLQVYSNTCTWRDWGHGAAQGEEEELRPRGRRSEAAGLSMSRPALLLYLLQWILLPCCVTCCIIGLSSPLVETKIFIPEVRWLANEDAIERYEHSTRPGTGHVIKSGRSYLDLISSLYAGRLPCSALVVAYNSVVMPPLQFIGFFLVLLGKGRFIRMTEDTMEAIKHYTLDQAPKRFTNPMVLMTGVGVIQLTAPSGKMEAGFTKGYWFFLGYVCSCLFLAWSLSLDLDGDSHELEAGDAGASRGSQSSSRKLDLPIGSVNQMKVSLSKASRMNGEEDSYEDDGASDRDSEAGAPQGLQAFLWSKGWEVMAFLGLLPTIAVSMYLGLTQPFLSFDYRLSGILVQQSEPSVYQIWSSLGEKSRLLKYFSAVTLIVTLVVWVMLLGLEVLAKSRQRPGSKPQLVARLVGWLELTVRPWVLGHVWAFCLALVYYVVTARNKAVVEVCAHFPRRPIGMAAILVMGGSIVSLLSFGKGFVDPPHHKRKGTALNLPGPGGTWLWAGGAAVVGCFWLFILYTHGPTLDPEIAGLEDVNTVLSKLLPVTNTRIHAQIPESSGDCEALWEHRVLNGNALFASQPFEVYRRCKGTAPLVHQTRKEGRTSMEVTAKWATGLNTLEVMDILILPPANISAYTQQWNMTIKAKFSDLKVWLKVDLGEKEWVDDYMCCDNPFHFTVQASVLCTLGYGFQPIQLNVLDMDPINFKHRVEVERTQDFSASWNIDYGRSGDVEQMLRNILTGKRGKLLIKNSDGSTTDPLASASHFLNKIVSLNTGQQCLYNW